MRHLVVAAVVALCASLPSFTGSEQSCCDPTLRWSPQSFSYTLSFDSGISQQQRDTFSSRTEESRNRWNNMFSLRLDNTTITASSQGSVTVHVSSTFQALQWSCHPNCNSRGDHTLIQVPLDWVDGTVGHNDVIVDMQHEFGHRIGYEQASCCQSVMGDPCGQQDFSSCDLNMFNDDIGFPDVDGDGYPSDGDCNDADPNQYPGAVDTHPWCGSQQEWPCDTDYNCNADADCAEIGTICTNSPIILDLSGNGFALTNARGGVFFDLNLDGAPERLPWTHPAGDDAWLALDRNLNGRIDDGRELFGNWTEQLPTPVRNGFEALALLGQGDYGGNGDRWIDDRDAVYRRLLLWRDANHDGASQPAELRRLSAAGVARLSLTYREFLRVDQFHNWFRFGARVFDGRGRDVGPMAFDVFLDYPAHLIPPGEGRKTSRRR